MSESVMPDMRRGVPMPDENPDILAARLECDIDTDLLVAEAWETFQNSGEHDYLEGEELENYFKRKMAGALTVLDYVTGLSDTLPAGDKLRQAYDKKHTAFTGRNGFEYPSDFDEPPYALYDDKGQPVGFSWGYEESEVALRHYQPLLKETLYPKLKQRLVQDEPLLLALDMPERKDKIVDLPMLQILKNCLRHEVETKHAEMIDSSAAISPVRREFTRRSNALEDDPPQRPLSKRTEEGMSPQLKQQFRERSSFYFDAQTGKEFSPEVGYLHLLENVCGYLSYNFDRDEMTLDATLEMLCNEPMHLLDLHAVTLNDLERQKFSQWLSDTFDGFDFGIGGDYYDGFDDYDDQPSYDSVSDLLQQSEKRQSAMTGARSIKQSFPEVVFSHNGGPIMEGRMAIRAVGSLMGLESDPADVITLEGDDVDEGIIIPGFAVSNSTDEGLTVTAAERDPYDISEVRVPAARVAVLAELYRDNGMAALGQALHKIAQQPNARLDLIVDAIETATVYEEQAAWGGNVPIDITKLRQNGLIEMGIIKGNCTVSSGVLSAALEMLGLEEIQVIGGVPLSENAGVLPLHAQVSFRDPLTGLTHVADATGGADHFLKAWKQQARLQKRLDVIVGDEVVPTEERVGKDSPEVIAREPSATDIISNAQETQKRVLELAVTLATPPKLTDELRDYQVGALAQLDEQHILRELYRLTDSRTVNEQSYTTYMQSLSAYIAKCDRLLKPTKQPALDFMNPVERFRHHGLVQSGRESLFGGDETVLTYARQIAADLRVQLAKI